MDNKVGKTFETLAHRVIYSYIGSFPDFVPLKDSQASEQSQRDMYDFMKSTLSKIYEEPSLLSLPAQPDEFYEDWELQNRKPKLILAMKSISKKINDLLQIMLQIGLSGDIAGDTLVVHKDKIKFTKNMLMRLTQFGLYCEDSQDEYVFSNDDYPELFPAWKLISGIAIKQSDPVLFFSRCMFNLNHPYAADIFSVLTNNEEAFNILRDFFEKNGYKRVECRESLISLDWVRNYGKKDEPLKASWGEREHGGISIWFDYTKRNQIFYGLRIPKFKELMLHFDEMEDRLKEFVINKNKKCDGCGYCTQTDKTGARKRLYQPVSHNGNYNLCLLFPGFSYVWTSIDEHTAEIIILFLKYIDKVFQSSEK